MANILSLVLITLLISVYSFYQINSDPIEIKGNDPLWNLEVEEKISKTVNDKHVISNKKESKFYLYLLIGQSNMVGLGEVNKSEKMSHPNVLVFNKNNQWEVAVDPLHNGGVGIGISFGLTLLKKDENLKVGLIPCAVSGTAIDFWEKDRYYSPNNTYLYNNAIFKTREAIKTGGVLKGVLWHQGESDSLIETKDYEFKLIKLINNLREDLNNPNLPFIAGKLGYFLEEKRPFSKTINTIIESIPTLVPYTDYVDVSGLSHKGDKLHFNTPSYRELGKRYAEKITNLQSN